jgi:nanoRNase/pAp phosphatase (c-di-AMP/oligoRNAs hydrolase)
MARRSTTAFGSTRAVTVIGHNNHVVPTVGLFVGGSINVVVYTDSEHTEEDLAPYPGVTVHRVPSGYEAAPTDLPDGAYFLCVDKEEVAKRIRGWLPQTLAIFHVGTEHRGRTAASGFLSLAQSQSLARRNLLKRLSTIRRVDRIMAMVRNAELPLILMYADPDPDAIGAALGLAAIMKAAGASPIIRYTGEVQRYQNKLMLQYIKEPIDRLREHEMAGADVVAVVDCQPGFWRKDPPHAHIVIDHHPRLDETSAPYLDLRDDYGSTATILIEYLTEANIPIRRKLATALLYGLMTDTADLSRHTCSADIKAYDAVHAKADHYFLGRLAKAVIPANMLDQIAWGISHRLVYRDLMLIHFGEIDTPDLLVQVADTMLHTCGINWVVTAGKAGDRFVVVFRGDGHRQDVGSRAKSAFGKIGSAGGHRTMGRAEIVLNGEHVDVTVDLLVDNLFKRMSESRRERIRRTLRNHLHGAGPRQTPPSPL